MKKILNSFAILIILTACSPSEESIQQALLGTIQALPTATALPTLEPYPTYTQQPTYTPLPTYTPEPPKVIVITATSSPTPEFTPTVTNTPTATVPPTATSDPLKTAKGPGIYLVGVDIAPGVWRSQAESDNCYWERDDKTGEIIDNHFGFAGGTMYIGPNDFSVEVSEECGTWVFLSEP